MSFVVRIRGFIAQFLTFSIFFPSSCLTSSAFEWIITRVPSSAMSQYMEIETWHRKKLLDSLNVVMSGM
jgi:hypothetical protein